MATTTVPRPVTLTLYRDQHATYARADDFATSKGGRLPKIEDLETLPKDQREALKNTAREWAGWVWLGDKSDLDKEKAKKVLRAAFGEGVILHVEADKPLAFGYYTGTGSPLGVYPADEKNIARVIAVVQDGGLVQSIGAALEDAKEDWVERFPVAFRM